MYRIWDGEIRATELIKDLIQEGNLFQDKRNCGTKNFHDASFGIFLMILFIEVKEGNLFLILKSLLQRIFMNIFVFDVDFKQT